MFRSHRPSILLCCSLLALVAFPAGASPTTSSTLEMSLGPVSSRIATGIGVSSVSRSFGYILRAEVLGGTAGALAVPVTDPEVTGTIASFRPDVSLQPGAVAPLHGGHLPLTESNLALHGVVRVCIVFSGCGSSIPLPFNRPSTAGIVGIGGTITTAPGAVRVSVIGAPWTPGTASAVTRTANGDFKIVTMMGFLHHVGSGTFPAAQDGIVQLVTPIQIVTKGFGPGPMVEKIALFATLTLRVNVPEPGVPLALGSGAVALILMGIRRSKRPPRHRR